MKPQIRVLVLMVFMLSELFACGPAVTPTSPSPASGPSPTAPALTPAAGQPLQTPLAAGTTSEPPTSTANTPTPTPASIPAFDHIFIIVEENESAGAIISSTKAPYINSLIAQYALATNYSAILHPSLPNYLTLTGGSNFGITSDCTDCFVKAVNIVDRLESAGKTWKGYMESMPSPCFVGNSGSLYAQKHDPFIYYDDIRTDPARCNQLVPFSQLANDLGQTSTTPNYVWITPNLCNDMHDCSISTGDGWLQANLPAIFDSPAWKTQNSLMFITWDEGLTDNNQVATLVISRSVTPGFRSSVSYNHYSLLRTVEAAWGLAPLTTYDGHASPMADFWP